MVPPYTKERSSSLCIPYTPYDVSLNDLLPVIQKPLSMHNFCSKPFSPPVSKLHTLYHSCLENHVTNPYSKMNTIVLDIARHRLFKPVSFKEDEIDKRCFLILSYVNNGLHAFNENINISFNAHDVFLDQRQKMNLAVSITNYSNLKFLHILKISPYL